MSTPKANLKNGLIVLGFIILAALIGFFLFLRPPSLSKIVALTHLQMPAGTKLAKSEKKAQQITALLEIPKDSVEAFLVDNEFSRSHQTDSSIIAYKSELSLTIEVTVDRSSGETQMLIRLLQ